MENKEFKKLLKKVLPEDFIRMKETIGDHNYDVLNIITGTLLSDALVFMKKIGVLEEFLKDKNQISHWLVDGLLENRKSEME